MKTGDPIIMIKSIDHSGERFIGCKGVVVDKPEGTSAIYALFENKDGSKDYWIVEPSEIELIAP